VVIRWWARRCVRAGKRSSAAIFLLGLGLSLSMSLGMLGAGLLAEGYLADRFAAEGFLASVLLPRRALAEPETPFAMDAGGAAMVGLGRPVHTEDAGSPLVFPDGAGLPLGRGSVKLGEEVYARACAVCHGRRGEGATADA